MAASFQLGLDNSESVFERKTQAFGTDDSQATQIEEIEGTEGEGKGDFGAAHCTEKTDKNGVDFGLNKSATSQQSSQELDLKSPQAAVGKTEESPSSPKLLSQSANGQSMNVSTSVANSQQSQLVLSTPLSQQVCKGVPGKDLTASSCSQSATPAGEPASSAAVIVPSQSLSQSVIPSQKDGANEGGQGRMSQSSSQNHKPDSISNTEEEQKLSQRPDAVGQAEDRDDEEEEEEERMDEGGIQSTSRTECSSGFGLALSQSQVCSPEPMEEEEEVVVSQPVPEKAEESFSIMVLEESQRVSQEGKEKILSSQPFKSASQPARSSLKEAQDPGRKVMSSQLGSSGQAVSEARPSGGSRAPNAENVANKSLSDSSGGRISS